MLTRFYIPLLIVVFASAVPLRAGEGDAGAFNETTGRITLRQAISLALVHHPELRVFAHDIRIAEARRIQAKLPPNPTLDLTVQDVGGSGPYSGTDRAETTLEIGQALELGGKRRARTRAALKGRELAQWDFETKRLEVAAKTTSAFVELLGVQRRLSMARETLTLAERFAPVAQKRVEAGAASPLEVTRANVATASAKIAVEQQKGQLAVARKRLAACWGSTTPRFSDAVGNLDRTRELPELKAATRLLANNPQLARRDTELEQRRAQLASEKAKVWPDVTVAGGVRRIEESDHTVAVFGLSLPLPLLNRNQGGIQEARVQIERAEDQHRATEVQLTTSLAISYEELEDASIQIAEYRKSVLPQVEEAWRLTNEGYESGKFSHLEVLDARRTLAETREQYLEALIRYHKAVAEIEALTGQALSAIPTNER